MLDDGKVQALLSWVNGILKTSILSLDGLKGEVLHSLLRFLFCHSENEQVQPSSADGHITAIKYGLETLYGCSMDRKLSFDKLEGGDITELAKACLLLVTAGIIHGGEAFVKPALELEFVHQQNILFMVTGIIKADQKLENIDDEYYKVLFEKTEVPNAMVPIHTSTPHGEFNRRTLSSTPLNSESSCNNDLKTSGNRDNISILAPITTFLHMKDLDYPVSPLQQLVNSPNVSSKHSEQFVRRLQQDLQAQKLRRKELEDDLHSKDEELHDQKNVITALNQQIAKLSQRLTRLEEESLNSSLPVDSNAILLQEVRSRNEEILRELKDLKDRNNFLERDNESLYEQLRVLRCQTSDCGQQNNDKSSDLSAMVCQLQDALDKNESCLRHYVTSYEELKAEMAQQREIYQQRIEELTKKLEKSGISENGECLGDFIEQDLREQLTSAQQQLMEKVEEEKLLTSEMLVLKADNESLQRQKVDLEERFCSSEKKLMTDLEEKQKLLEQEQTAKNVLERKWKNEQKTSLEQITLLKSEICMTKESNQKLENQVDSFQKRIYQVEEQLQRSIECFEMEKVVLKDKVKTAEDRYDCLELELHECRSRLSEGQAALEQHSSKVVELETEMRSKVTDLNSAHDLIKDLKATINDKDRDRLQLTTEVELAKKQREETELKSAETVDQLQAKLVQYHDEIVSLEESVKVFQNNGFESEEKLETATQELTSAQDLIKNLNITIKNSDQELIQLKGELEKSKDLFKELELSSKERITQLEDKLVISRREVVSLEEVSEMFQNRQSQMEEKLKSSRSEIEAIREEMKNEAREAEGREETLEEELEMIKESHQHQVDSLRSRIFQNEEEMKKAAESFDLEKTLLEKKLSTSEENNERLKSELQTYLNQLSTVDDKLREKSSELAKLEEENLVSVKLNEELVAARLQIKDSGEKILELEAELVAAQKSILSLTEQIDGLEKNENQLNEKLRCAQDEVLSAKGPLVIADEAERVKVQLIQEREDLVKEISQKLESEIEAYQKQIRLIEDQNTKSRECFEADKAILLDKLNDADVRYSSIELEYQSCCCRLSAAEENLEKNLSKVNCLEEELHLSKHFRDNLNSAHNLIESLKTVIFNGDQDPIDYEAKLETSNESYVHLEEMMKQRIECLNNSKANLEDKLKIAEGQSSDLKSELESCRIQLSTATEDLKEQMTKLQEELLMNGLLRQDLESAQTQIKEMETSISKSVSECGKLESELETVRRQRKELELVSDERGNQLEVELFASQKEISSLKELVSDSKNSQLLLEERLKCAQHEACIVKEEMLSEHLKAECCMAQLKEELNVAKVSSQRSEVQAELFQRHINKLEEDLQKYAECLKNDISDRVNKPVVDCDAGLQLDLPCTQLPTTKENLERSFSIVDELKEILLNGNFRQNLISGQDLIRDLKIIICANERDCAQFGTMPETAMKCSEEIETSSKETFNQAGDLLVFLEKDIVRLEEWINEFQNYQLGEKYVKREVQTTEEMRSETEDCKKNPLEDLIILSERNQELECEVDSLQKQICLNEEEIRDRTKHFDMDMADLLNQLKTSEQKSAAIELEFHRCCDKLSATEEVLSRQLSRVNQLENEALQGQNLRQDLNSALIEDLKATILEKDQSRIQLNGELEAVRELSKGSELKSQERICELEDKLSRSEEKNVSLEDLINVLQNSHSELEDKLQSEVDTAREMLRDNLAMAESHRVLEAELSAVNDRNDLRLVQLNGELEAVRELSKESELKSQERICELEDKLSTSQEKIVSLEDFINELQNSQSDLEDKVENEVDTAREMLKDNLAMAESHRALEAELGAVKESNLNFKNKVDVYEEQVLQMKGELKESTADFETSKADLMNKLTASEDLRASLELKLQTSHSQLSIANADVEKHSSMIAKLEEDLRKTEDLKLNLHAAEDLIKDLKTEISSKEQDHDHLASELETLKVRHQELEMTSMEKLVVSQREVESLRESIVHFKVHQVQTEEKLAQSRVDVENARVEMQNEVREAKRREETLEQELKVTLKMYADLKLMLEQLEEEKTRKSNQVRLEKASVADVMRRPVAIADARLLRSSNSSHRSISSSELISDGSQFFDGAEDSASMKRSESVSTLTSANSLKRINSSSCISSSAAPSSSLTKATSTKSKTDLRSEHVRAPRAAVLPITAKKGVRHSAERSDFEFRSKTQQKGGFGAYLHVSSEPEEHAWDSLSQIQKKKIFAEPVEDRDRVAELQRRNTLCLPHLKSIYPVESLDPGCDERVLLFEDSRSANGRTNGKRSTADAGLRSISEEFIVDEKRKSPKKSVGHLGAASIQPFHGRAQSSSVAEAPKENVSFNIGFTPKKALNRLLGRKKKPLGSTNSEKN